MKTRFLVAGSILLVVMLCAYLPIYGQMSVPPSPTAASLGKYGDIPVNLYTGTPSIQIPLWNLQERVLSVPIGLSYHASGIKAGERASWVGIGWSLNAGGVITRTMRGKDDFGDKGYISLGNKKPTTTALDSNCKDAQGNDFSDVFIGGDYDLEPDMFYFNFLGYSGKFVLDHQGNIRELSQQNIQITYSAANQALQRTWTIRTPDGVRYVFGENNQLEETSAVDSCASNYYYSQMVEGNSQYTGSPINTYTTYGTFHTSAWYLSKIIGVNGEEITFHYSPYTSTIKYPARTTVVGGNQVTTCRQKVITQGVRLTSIKGSFGEVDFESSQNRKDAPGEAKLEAIKIYKGAGTQRVLHKQYALEHSYSPTNPQEQLGNISGDAIWSHYLFLHRLQEKNAQGKLYSTGYRFLYKDGKLGLSSPMNLFQTSNFTYYYGPSSTGYSSYVQTISPKQSGTYDAFDLWGYRMGEISPCDPSQITLCPDCPTYGMLKEVIYPTGGKTELTFEAHDFRNYRNPSDTLHYNQQAIEVFSANHGDTTYYAAPKFPGVQNSKTIVVNTPSTLEAKELWRQGCGNQDSLEYNYIEVKIIPENNPSNPIIHQIVPPTYPELNNTSVLSIPKGTLIITAKRLCTSPWIVNNATVNLNVPSEVYGKFCLTSAYPKKNEIGGGIRIKRQVDYADATSQNPAKITDYVYRLPQEPEKSSGLMMSEPRNSGYDASFHIVPMTRIDTLNKDIIPPTIQETLIGYNIASSIQKIDTYGYSLTPLSSSAQGSAVGYDYVTVIQRKNLQDTEATLGKTVYQFYNKPDSLLSRAPVDNSWNLPYEEQLNAIIPFTMPNHDYAYINGSPLEVTVFHANGDSLSHQKSVYQEKNVENILGYKYGFRSTGQIVDVINGVSRGAILRDIRNMMCSYLVVKSYHTRSGWLHLNKTIEKQYSYLGGQKRVMVDTSHYFYEQAIHKQLTRLEKRNSKGEKVITRYRYVSDLLPQVLTSPTGSFAQGLNRLMEQGMNAVLLEEQTFKQKGNQTYLMGAKVTEFKPFTLSNNTIVGVPSKIHQTELLEPITNYEPLKVENGSLVMDNRLILQAIYDEHDAQTGSLVETHAVDGNYSCQILSQDRRYVLAQVSNARKNQVFYNGFEESGGVTDVQAKTGTQVKTGSYTVPFTAPDSKEYILTYWYYQNGKWNYREKPFNTTNATINEGSKIDEVRVYPKGSGMVTYAYKPMIGVSSVTDANNYTLYYEYDDLQRLQIIKDEKGNLVKTYFYHYQK